MHCTGAGEVPEYGTVRSHLVAMLAVLHKAPFQVIEGLVHYEQVGTLFPCHSLWCTAT